MKKSVIVFVAAAIATQVSGQFASADILPPHNPNAQTHSTSTTVSNPEASEIWRSMKTPVIPGSSSGYTGDYTSYRVERSEDGLEQTICTMSGNYRSNMMPLTTCTVEKSTDGKPLPKFVRPAIHMG